MSSTESRVPALDMGVVLEAAERKQSFTKKMSKKIKVRGPASCAARLQPGGKQAPV